VFLARPIHTRQLDAELQTGRQLIRRCVSWPSKALDQAVNLPASDRRDPARSSLVEELIEQETPRWRDLPPLVERFEASPAGGSESAVRGRRGFWLTS